MKGVDLGMAQRKLVISRRIWLLKPIFWPDQSAPRPPCPTVALLHRDATDRLAAGVLDDADAQRLQLAVALTEDQPFPRNCDGAGGGFGDGGGSVSF